MADLEFIDISEELHLGERGSSFFPWQGRLHDPEEVLRTCHLISINPGHSRGNHYHPGHEEWLYLFHGQGLISWEAGGRVREQSIAGSRTLIRIPAGITHVVTNPGPDLVYLIAWRQPTGGGPTEPETVPKIITEPT